MLGEPGQNAVRMVHVLTGQLLGFVIDYKLVLADGAENDWIGGEECVGDFEGGD